MKIYDTQELLSIIKEEFPDDHPSPDVLTDIEVVTKINRWLERGDGVAVYQNEDLGHYELGKRQLVSFGSSEAMLEVEDPPKRLPDIGGNINWRYQLQGIYRGGAL